jgi:hypothetical protein
MPAKKKPVKAKAKKNNRNTTGGLKLSKGQGFHTNPERINKKGRPPKLWTQITQELKEKGYPPLTETQIIEAYTVLLQLPKAEVTKLLNDSKTPESFQIVIKYMRSPNGIQMLDRIMDRSFGKVFQRQTLEANIKTEQPLFPDVVVNKQASDTDD